ncbi:MAG: HlyC/CorC family transporter [Candidatus Omnitrophica bacterium]|nr:HlyC/CorC family transporter [Candidatus Omnitrophota bacterium]
MQLNLIPIFIILLILLSVISAFLSSAESALIAISKIRLRHLVEKKVRFAKLAFDLIANLDRLIATILVSNNFVNIAISAIGTSIFVFLFGNHFIIIGLSTLIITIFILIFCEITPKIFALQRAEKVSLFSAGPMYFLISILSPIVKFFTIFSNFLISLFGIEKTKRSPLITEEELKLMIEIGKEEGVILDEERKMLHRIFEFGDTIASEVMVPRKDIVAVSVDATADELLNLFVEEGHSRVPVYKENIDNIIGIVYARDLLHIWLNKQLIIIPDLIHPAFFVNQSKKVNDLLRDFKQKRIHMAIVVDNTNHTLGLVTLEDLTEEIIGEIEDEQSLKMQNNLL